MARAYHHEMNASKREPAAGRTPSKKVAAAKKKVVAPPLEPSTKPFLRFYHSPELRKKTNTVLTTLQDARDPTTIRGPLGDIAVELTNAGLEYYFMQPLKRAKVGFVTEQSARLGMTGVQQLMGSVIRNVIGRMDGPQLLSVGQSLRLFMR